MITELNLEPREPAPATDWRRRHTEILEGLWSGYKSTMEFDPNSVACILGLAEEIRLGITAGLLDGPHQPGSGPCPPPPVHGAYSRCRWEQDGTYCYAPIIYSATARNWLHEGGYAVDHNGVPGEIQPTRPT